jgi:putative transcriptional regulator
MDQLINRLKDIRLQNNMTQQDLADSLDVSRQSINAIERGRYSPSIELALKMAKLFHIPVEDIFALP